MDYIMQSIYEKYGKIKIPKGLIVKENIISEVPYVVFLKNNSKGSFVSYEVLEIEKPSFFSYFREWDCELGNYHVVGKVLDSLLVMNKKEFRKINKLINKSRRFKKIKKFLRKRGISKLERIL